MGDHVLDEVEREVAARRLDQLRALEVERSALILVEMYPTMHTEEQKTQAAKRLPQLRVLINAEQKRLASLRGEGLAERQLEDAQQMIDANARMAAAAESAAAASADAARFTKRAAFWTALAAIGSLIAAAVSLLTIFRR